MNLSELKSNLLESHRSFISTINGLSDEEFIFSANGKWTAGQQAEHLLLSVKPLNKILAMPKLTVKVMFGTANRPSKTYEALVQKYETKLAEGGKATVQFVPPVVELKQKEILLSELLSRAEKLCRQLDDFTEEQMDEYILPHPLLGKLTLREMMHFTIHHVGHHQKITLRNLGR